MYENGPNHGMGLGTWTDVKPVDKVITYIIKPGDTLTETFHRIMYEVSEELKRATANYGPMHSEHEAYAVILEELEELWDEIKKKPKLRDKDRMYEEAVQAMAMLARFIIDCKLPVDKV